MQSVTAYIVPIFSRLAGEALNPEVYNRWLEYTGLKLMEGFGQTETVVVVANIRQPPEQRGVP